MTEMDLNYSTPAPAISLLPPERSPMPGSLRDAAASVARVYHLPPARGPKLRHPAVPERPANHEGVLTFDLSGDGREWKATWPLRLESSVDPCPHQERE